jgi:hypothetical protein
MNSIKYFLLHTLRVESNVQPIIHHNQKNLQYLRTLVLIAPPHDHFQESLYILLLPFSLLFIFIYSFA